MAGLLTLLGGTALGVESGAYKRKRQEVQDARDAADVAYRQAQADEQRRQFIEQQQRYADEFAWRKVEAQRETDRYNASLIDVPGYGKMTPTQFEAFKEQHPDIVRKWNVPPSYPGADAVIRHLTQPTISSEPLPAPPSFASILPSQGSPDFPIMQSAIDANTAYPAPSVTPDMPMPALAPAPNLNPDAARGTRLYGEYQAHTDKGVLGDKQLADRRALVKGVLQREYGYGPDMTPPMPQTAAPDLTQLAPPALPKPTMGPQEPTITLPPDLTEEQVYREVAMLPPQERQYALDRLLPLAKAASAKDFPVYEYAYDAKTNQPVAHIVGYSTEKDAKATSDRNLATMKLIYPEVNQTGQGKRDKLDAETGLTEARTAEIRKKTSLLDDYLDIAKRGADIKERLADFTIDNGRARTAQGYAIAKLRSSDARATRELQASIAQNKTDLSSLIGYQKALETEGSALLVQYYDKDGKLNPNRTQAGFDAKMADITGGLHNVTAQIRKLTTIPEKAVPLPAAPSVNVTVQTPGSPAPAPEKGTAKNFSRNEIKYWEIPAVLPPKGGINPQQSIRVLARKAKVNATDVESRWRGGLSAIQQHEPNLSVADAYRKVYTALLKYYGVK